MVEDSYDLVEQLDRHLSSPSQAWLLGAGISKDAGVPLMNPLTARVRSLAENTPHKSVLDALFQDLPTEAHIEHFLSHLGDYTAIAERTKVEDITVSNIKIKASALREAHKAVVTWIADTIRWGYREARAGEPEVVGESKNPLVTIDAHKSFVRALFKTAQAGLHDRRGPIYLFSINYDTLLEDALALSAVSHWDGFSGGAVAFRNHNFGEKPPEKNRAYVVKLHGSIDWHLGDDGRVWRVRDGDAYPTRTSRVLIYPQATKYMATQRDPFAAQFDLFRRTLSTTTDNVLAICGYSFGDAHINEEIESAMVAPNNRTTMIVFFSESNGLAECLKKWCASEWGKRLYVATEKGLYVGTDEPCRLLRDGKAHDWWTFAGVTKLLNDGAKDCL